MHVQLVRRIPDGCASKPSQAIFHGFQHKRDCNKAYANAQNTQKVPPVVNRLGANDEDNSANQKTVRNNAPGRRIWCHLASPITGAHGMPSRGDTAARR